MQTVLLIAGASFVVLILDTFLSLISWKVLDISVLGLSNIMLTWFSCPTADSPFSNLCLSSPSKSCMTSQCIPISRFTFILLFSLSKLCSCQKFQNISYRAAFEIKAFILAERYMWLVFALAWTEELPSLLVSNTDLQAGYSILNLLK